MASSTTRVLVNDPEFLALVQLKNRVSYSLTAVMLLLYFSYFFLLAFWPQVLAQPAGNGTLGIPLGIGVIVLSCILTAVYVWWANTRYDTLLQAVRTRLEQESAQVDSSGETSGGDAE